MKILIIITLFFLAACKATKFHAGTYRVETAKNYQGKSVVRLEGFQREFVFSTDTLKKGDLVYFVERPKEVKEIGQ